MYFSACDAKSSESLHKLRQMHSAFDSAGSTTTEEKDSKVIGPE